MPDLENVKQRLRDDQFAERCNIELLSVTSGRASARMTLHPHHRNGIGTVQGGAIFTLADFTFAAAANSHGAVSVAVNASITFMKAAGTGTLWAEARELAMNFKIGTYSVEIKDDQGDLVAHFQGLAYRKKEKV
jgi:acyl-CoA thioesterase